MKKISIALVLIVTLTLNATAQSLLTQEPDTQAQQTARVILAGPSQIRASNLAALDDLSARLWLAPDPQAVLDEMGTNAGYVLDLFDAWGQTLGAFLTGQSDSEGLARLAAIQARKPDITVHEDGTVTIDPPEEEE